MDLRRLKYKAKTFKSQERFTPWVHKCNHIVQRVSTKEFLSVETFPVVLFSYAHNYAGLIIL